MSVPPEIAQALAGGGGPKPAGPSASPMTTPQPKQGNEQGARADIQVMLKKLTMTMQTFPPGTEQGDAILKAVTALSKAFGDTASKDKELMPAEIQQAITGLAGPGKPPAGLPQPAGSAPMPTPM